VRRAVLLVTSALLIAACGGEQGESDDSDKPDEDDAPSGVDPNLRIGHVMFEVGYRFEMAGQAAEAERWELAAYQSQEIAEMFDMDMSRALLPGDCNDEIADTMYMNLLRQLPRLREAAEAEDADAFAEQFAVSSGNCNGCHAGCNVPFIQVPDAVGAQVPRVAAPAPETEPETAPQEATSP